MLNGRLNSMPVHAYCVISGYFAFGFSDFATRVSCHLLIHSFFKELPLGVRDAKP